MHWRNQPDLRFSVGEIEVEMKIKLAGISLEKTESKIQELGYGKFGYTKRTHEHFIDLSTSYWVTYKPITSTHLDEIIEPGDDPDSPYVEEEVTSYNEHTIITGYQPVDGPVSTKSGEMYAENKQEEDVWMYGGPDCGEDPVYEYCTDVQGRVGENGVDIISYLVAAEHIGKWYEYIGEFDPETGSFADFWDHVEMPEPDYCELEED